MVNRKFFGDPSRSVEFFLNLIKVSKLDVKIYNNNEVKLNVDTKISDIPKTWPAFGKFGGIPEILIEAQDDIQLVCHQEIMNGGAVEQWHQDGVGNYKLPLKIANIIRYAVQANDEFVSPDGSNDENSILGITKGNNVLQSCILPLDRIPYPDLERRA